MPLMTKTPFTDADYLASLDVEPGTYSFKKRAEEKAASRAQDAEDLATGKKTSEQLTKENSIFSGLKCVLDVEYAKRSTVLDEYNTPEAKKAARDLFKLPPEQFETIHESAKKNEP